MSDPPVATISGRLIDATAESSTEPPMLGMAGHSHFRITLRLEVDPADFLSADEMSALQRRMLPGVRVDVII